MSVGLSELHSFPTRRSSDLGSAAERGGDAVAAQAAQEGFRGFGRGGTGFLTSEVTPLVVNNVMYIGTRSEEHTSELQSHVNLVCRLLLEKKKKKDNM